MDQLNVWKQSLTTAVTTLWAELAIFAPKLVAALVIFLVGLLVAKVVAVLLTRLLKRLGIDRLADRSGMEGVLNELHVERPLSAICGRFGFWVIMIMVMLSASDALGLQRVAMTLNQILSFLPKIAASVLILLLGLAFAQFVRRLVRRSAGNVGLEYGRAAGNAAYGLILVLVVSLVIGELEIETQLLNSVILAILASVGVAVALAMGLGSRELASNIIAGVYARELFSPGCSVSIEADERSGQVLEVGVVKTLIALESGDVLTLPNRFLIDEQILRRD